MYRLALTKTSQSQLEKLPDKEYLKIREALNMLKENPRPFGCKKLTGKEGYRIRSGNYRVLYFVNDKSKEVQVYKIAHRKEAYR